MADTSQETGVSHLWSELVPPEIELFFSKGDEKDPRMGEIVRPLSSGSSLDGVDVAFIGVPEDRGIRANGGREGARLGPRFIRKAFYRLTPGFRPSLSDLSIVDVGDIRTEGKTLEEVHEGTRSVVAAVASKGVIPIVLGGGHDLTYPGLHGFVDGFGFGEGELGVVNVDSHLDVRDMSHGLTSGTPFFRILEELPGRPVKGGNFAEFGIQELHNSPWYYKWLRDTGASIFTLKSLQGRPMETFLQALQAAGEGTRAVAVSIDIDAARSTDAPGASASNPNGLSAQDLEKVAYLAGRTERVRFFDIMETSPPLDVDGRTSALAAAVLFWFLKGLCERR